MTQPGDYKIYDDLSRLNNELATAQRELAQKNSALFLEQEKLQVTLRSMRNGAVTTGTDGIITLINPAALDLIGRDVQDCMGHPFDSVFLIIREDNGIPLSGLIQQVLAAETLTTRGDLSLHTDNGKQVPVELSCAPITDLKGDQRGVVIIVQDVTLQRGMTRELQRLVKERTADLEADIELRKEAEQRIRGALAEKEILVKELHHRVKNNLQIISSMLNLQAKKMKDPVLQQALKESLNRIRTLSAVHEKVLSSQDLSRIDLKAYVRHLVNNLLALYAVKPGSITVTVEIPDIFVDINTAIPLGLVLNELVANSLKHAFPDGRTGEVAITIRDEDRALAISCGDDGIGMPPGYDWENPDTVGLILVISLVGQLEGTIKKLPGGGTHFVIMVPQSSDDKDSPIRGTYNTVPG
jgi:PAS domain S-box-containing protein